MYHCALSSSEARTNQRSFVWTRYKKAWLRKRMRSRSASRKAGQSFFRCSERWQGGKAGTLVRRFSYVVFSQSCRTLMICVVPCQTRQSAASYDRARTLRGRETSQWHFTREQHVCPTAGNNPTKKSATTLSGAMPLLISFMLHRLTFKWPVTHSEYMDDADGSWPWGKMRTHVGQEFAKMGFSATAYVASPSMPRLTRWSRTAFSSARQASWWRLRLWRYAKVTWKQKRPLLATMLVRSSVSYDDYREIILLKIMSAEGKPIHSKTSGSQNCALLCTVALGDTRVWEDMYTS